MMRVAAVLVWLKLVAFGMGHPLQPQALAGIPLMDRSRASCAAFSPAGQQAIAWVRDGVLAVAVAGGTPGIARFQLPPAPPPNPDRRECTLAFSRDGSRLAAAVQQGPESAALLQVEVIDPDRLARVHEFTIDARSGASGPFALLGFLSGSHAIAIGAAPENLSVPGPVSYTKVTTLVVRYSGRAPLPRLTRYSRTVTGDSSSEPPGWMDAAHNRLWYLNDPQFCPMQSVTLTGPPVSGPKVGERPDEAEFCERPGLLLYPDSGLLVSLDSKDEGGRIRTTPGAVAGGTESLDLPRMPARVAAHIGDAALSPDGQIGALSRNILSYGFFDIDRDLDDDLVVFQVRPLRMLAHLKAPRHRHRVNGLAVDSRNGQAVLLVCWDGTWTRYEIPIPAAPPGAESRRVSR